MKKNTFFLFVFLLIVTIAVAISCKNNKVEQTTVTSLDMNYLGKSIIKTLSSDPHVYEINMKPDEFIFIEFIQDGVDIQIKMVSPTGEEFNYDHQLGIKGLENFLFVSKLPGRHKLIVSQANQEVEPGKYNFKLVDFRSATKQDMVRYEGVKALWEGKIKMESEKSELLKKGLEDLEKASLRLKEANDLWHLSLAKNYTGNILYILGNYAEAKKVYDEGMAITKPLKDVDLESNILDSLSLIAVRESRIEDGINYENKAIDMVELEGDVLKKAYLLNNKANLLKDFFEVDEAIKCLEESVEIQKRYGKKRELAISLVNLGNVESAKTSYEKAINTSLEAIKLGKKYSPVAATYGNIVAARTYSAINDNDTALKYALDAQALAQEIGDDNAKNVNSLELGNIYNFQGDINKAFGFYNEVISKTTVPITKLKALNSLGSLYLKEGNLTEARKAFEEALKIAHEKNLQYFVGLSLCSLGKLSLSEKKYVESENLFQKSLAIYDQIGIPELQTENLFSLAKLFLEENKLEEAEKTIQKCINLSESIRNNFLVTDFKLYYFSQLKDYYDLYIQILLKKYSLTKNDNELKLAFLTSEKSKARLLSETIISNHVESKLSSLDFQKNKLNLSIAQFRREKLALISKGKYEPDELKRIDTKLADLKAQYETLQKNLSADINLINLDFNFLETQSKFSETTVLEYQVGTNGAWVFVLTDGKINYFSLPNYQDINKNIRAIHRLEKQEKAINFYRNISDIVLKPIDPKLIKSNLIIIPDGALSYLPWAALPVNDSEKPKFLVENNEIVLLPSLSLLAIKDASKRLNSENVLVVSDPVFSLDDERMQSANIVAKNNNQEESILEISARALNLRSGEQRLPFTKVESDTIKTIYPEASVLTGFDANMINLTGYAGKHLRIIHMATHGIINTQAPELSSLRLSSFTKTGERIKGFLTLSDIYDLDLSADIIILSACESGLGKDIKGEGVMSFSRAFLATGSSNVISTLWKIDDQFASIFMKDFYKNLKDNPTDVVGALKRTQNKFINDPTWGNPFYWGAFTIQTIKTNF